MLSAAPRNCAASSAGRSRGGFGSRTRTPLSPAASGPKATVRSSRSAIARSVAAVARLKISVGENSCAIAAAGPNLEAYINVALTPVSANSVPKQRW